MYHVTTKLAELKGMGVPYAEVARVLGVSRETVCNWATGEVGSDFGEMPISNALDTIKARVTSGEPWVGKIEPIKLEVINKRGIEYARLDIETSVEIINEARKRFGNLRKLTEALNGAVSYNIFPKWKASGIPLSPRGVKFLHFVGRTEFSKLIIMKD